MSVWGSFMGRLRRTTQLMQDSTSRVLRMEGATDALRTPKLLLRLNQPGDERSLNVGCDADIGGTSTAKLSFTLTPNEVEAGGVVGDGSRGFTRFAGDMRLGVRPGLEGKFRTGYAGWRTKPRPTMFGELTDDISNHEFLALRLKVAGHPRTRNSFFVNIQADSALSTELYQHRLFFTRDDGGWEDIYIPFSSFVLTSYGEPASSDKDTTMERGELLRWLGISMLGGNAGVEGPYELDVHSIHAVNREDVKSGVIGEESSVSTPWRRSAL